MPDRVLIVDDDEDTLEVLTHIVRGDGFEVIQARNGKEALQIVNNQPPDIVILDRRLPDMDGLAVCEEVRRSSQIPILMLSALTTEADKVAGLNIGADDYIDKPFQPGELSARIRAHLRRMRADIERPKVQIGNLVLDPDSLELRLNGELVPVTRMEFELMYALGRAEGRTVPREKLIQEVWGETLIDPDGLNVYVRRLRRKIEDDPSKPKRLLTIHTVGYKLVNPGFNNSKPARTPPPRKGK